MSGYEAWSLAGWHTHLPGVADVHNHVTGLGDETIPELAAAAASRVPDRVAVTVDGEPLTHAGLDNGDGSGPRPPPRLPASRWRRGPR